MSTFVHSVQHGYWAVHAALARHVAKIKRPIVDLVNTCLYYKYTLKICFQALAPHLMVAFGYHLMSRY